MKSVIPAFTFSSYHHCTNTPKDFSAYHKVRNETDCIIRSGVQKKTCKKRVIVTAMF